MCEPAGPTESGATVRNGPEWRSTMHGSRFTPVLMFAIATIGAIDADAATNRVQVRAPDASFAEWGGRIREIGSVCSPDYPVRPRVRSWRSVAQTLPYSPGSDRPIHELNSPRAHHAQRGLFLPVVAAASHLK
jgi:hypothetical protein